MISQRTWRIFAYELKRNVRRKGFLFMTFGVPLLALLALVGYQIITDLNARNAPAEEAQPAVDFRGIKKAGYVDLSGIFDDPGTVLAGMLVRYPDEAAAKQALQAHEIDVYYLIAPDYVETGNVTANVPRFSIDQIGARPIQELVYSHIAGDDPALLTRLRDPANIQEINPQRENVKQDEGSRFGVMYIFSLTFIFGVFVTSGYLMQSVIDEKETRLIEILISSVRPTELLAGKILGLGLLGLIQIVAWGIGLFALAKVAGILNSQILFLVNLAVPWEILPIVLLYFLLGYLFFAAAYGAVGALSNSMQEGTQYAVVFTLPAALPYYFLSVFIQSPEGALPVIFSLFPLTAPLSMVMRLSISPVPAWQIIVSLILLALAVVGMMWAAGRLFRVQALLAGRLPKLRDIPKLLRG